MIEKDWTDKKLINAIKGQTKDREAAFRHIYVKSGWRSTFLTWSAQQKSSVSDGKDAFQMALLAFDKSVRGNQFKHQGKLKYYFLKIAKNKWIDIQRKKRLVDGLNEGTEEEIIEDVENVYISKEKR